MHRCLRRAPFRLARLALAIVMLSVASSVLVGVPGASGAPPGVDAATAWLRTQQQADGGFEVAGFPGFETADAVLALAAAGQADTSWSASEARAAVLGTSTLAGATSLDALDDFAESGIGAGQAAKLVVLVTNPLALDPEDFDPQGDGSTDLAGIVGEPGVDGTFGINPDAFNSILFAARAAATIDGDVPAATLTYVREHQKSDGSWDFLGNASGEGGDVDTTAAAVLALVADPDVTGADPDVAAALAYLGGLQGPNGAWQSFGTDDPNSTAVAVLAFAAAATDGPIGAAETYLRSQQQPDGRVASPNDGFGVNTFATSQAIQALVHPAVTRATTFVAPVTIPAFGGGAVSLEVTGDGAPVLDDVEAVDPASLPAPPDGAALPVGLVSFRVTGVTPGGTVTVRLVLPVGAGPFGGYLKFHDAAWLDATSLATFDGHVVTLTLTDGEPGDDDPTAGTIVDPGGPASLEVGGIVVFPSFTG